MEDDVAVLPETVLCPENDDEYIFSGEFSQEDAFDDEDTTPRPFVKWAGGKRQLLNELLARLPQEFNTYFEPFLGGGALFFALEPQQAVLSENNAELVNAYRVVKNQVFELIEDLSHHIHAKDYYYSVRDADLSEAYSSWSPVQRASRLLYLNRTCYNGLYRVNSKGHFNVPFGEYQNPKIVDRENLIACSRALSRAQILAEDFRHLESLAKADDFIYFDPPYHPRNSTSSFTSYTEDGFGAKMQEELRDLCQRLSARGVRFMLTNSETEFVRELYQDFNIDVVEASRAINSKAQGRGRIQELVIRNY